MKVTLKDNPIARCCRRSDFRPGAIDCTEADAMKKAALWAVTLLGGLVVLVVTVAIWGMALAMKDLCDIAGGH